MFTKVKDREKTGERGFHDKTMADNTIYYCFICEDNFSLDL